MLMFEATTSILYSDTMVPDIFINEYMPSMDGDTVKIYLHCMFLSKHNKSVTVKDLSKKLTIDLEKVKAGLVYLESKGIISRKENTASGIMMNDLKAIEIARHYRLKTTSTPEEAITSSDRNKLRNETVSAIIKKFFQGIIPPSWYTDIDNWFNKYQFEEDVMFSLFQYCYDQAGLSKNYMEKVAQGWASKGIKSGIDLDNYFHEYQRFKDLKGKIIKKLRLTRNLTEYEDNYLEKWVYEYKFDYSVIEIALKKTTGKANPTFNYLDSLIKSWYEKGCRNADEVNAHENKRQSQNNSQSGKMRSTVPQKSNYQQRQYSDDDFANLFDNPAINDKSGGAR
jgi:DnaD/phage-associated family protein